MRKGAMQQFQITMESEDEVDHADGQRRQGTRMHRLYAVDKDEAKSLAEQSAREERAQIILAGADEKSTPVYKVKKAEEV